MLRTRDSGAVSGKRDRGSRSSRGAASATRRLRVVAGEARGRKLVAPADVRPTTERVREAVFSMLAPRIAEASVLDLFAGSGAMAIEALSRGAAHAVLVDRSPSSAAACRANLDTTGLADRARVIDRPAEVLLATDPPREAPFDVVFCDPPYEMPGIELLGVVEALARPGWVAADGVVVVERPSGSEGRRQGWPAGWAVGWERRYGDTLVSVLSAV
jgi:16S rRNA (guanine966-N2)-methyltransferase